MPRANFNPYGGYERTSRELWNVVLQRQIFSTKSFRAFVAFYPALNGMFTGRFLSGGKRNVYWDQTGKWFDMSYESLFYCDSIMLFGSTATRDLLGKRYSFTAVF